MEIKERIKPFIFIEYENNYTLILTEGLYRYNIFKKRLRWGYKGNGFALRKLSEAFIEEKFPHLKGLIKYDEECDLYCAYSNDRETFLDFAYSFRDMCEDDEYIRELFKKIKLK
ncbi:MAG: immunity 51 family protein [Oscillospiraceae bacterium]|nr:immunity 51 family protein [Oscillospiraceae bacterium]